MAFKRWQKSPSKKPPEKVWTFEEMKTIGWCLNKNKQQYTYRSKRV